MAAQPATTGRLGNQLTHFAYALDLAREKGVGVSYDREQPTGLHVLVRDGKTLHRVERGEGPTWQIFGIDVNYELTTETAQAIRDLIPVEPGVNAVAVHVRLTDNPTPLPLDYYRRAKERMRELVGPLPVRLFSDDPSEAARMLQVYAHPSGNAEADLLLMARHRHHIIANSTFSWWAQFLGRRPGQVVISPRAWFKGQEGEGALNVTVH